MHIFTTENSKHNKASLKGNWDKHKWTCEHEITYHKISWMKTKFLLREFFSVLVEWQQTILYGCPKMAPWNFYLTFICASLLFWSGKHQKWKNKMYQNLFWGKKWIKFVASLISESITIQHQAYWYAYWQSLYRDASMYRPSSKFWTVLHKNICCGCTFELPRRVPTTYMFMEK